MFPLGAVAFGAFLLTLVLSDVAIEYMKKGLSLCASTVIPSLFPFMVIAELLVSSGVIEKISHIAAKPLRLLFGIDETAAGAFLAGALCGFPIGASTLASLYDKGRISKSTFSRALTFCNNPGSAFVISAVGVSLFGSRQIGVLLYCTTLLSAFILGVAGRFFKNRSGQDNLKDPPLASAFSSRSNGAEQFTVAIQKAGLGMLTVSAYVVFFSSLVGCLGALFQHIGLSERLSAAIFGLFELSSGVSAATGAFRGEIAVVFCGVLLGWSGLSVHFQVMTVCGGRGIKFSPYFLAKAAQGILCGILTFAALRLFPLSEEVWAQTPSARASSAYSNAAFVAVIFFAAALCPILLSLPFRRRKKVRLQKQNNGHTQNQQPQAEIAAKKGKI